MANTSDLKVGTVIKFNGENAVVTDLEFRKPGKGGAFYKTKLRYMKSGRFAENTFNSGETVEIIRVETRNYQFLYREGNNFIFMDAETYDQIYVDQVFVGDGAKFLKENQDLQIVFDGDDVMQVLMPAHVNLRITSTEPGLKGDTATNASKPATVETGTEIKVPLFVNEGDLIRLDTKNGAYIERVKE